MSQESTFFLTDLKNQLEEAVADVEKNGHATLIPF